MSAQLSLVYAPGEQGRMLWLTQLEAIRTAVGYLGLKEVSFALDVSGSMLSDALNERDRKRWACEWTQVLKVMLMKRADVIARKLLRGIVESEVAGTDIELADDEDDIDADELQAALAAINSVRRKKKARP